MCFIDALGDTIRILSSFYAIKHIYGCKLVIFGNALMRHLCNHTDFVDECVDIGELKACHIELINSYHCDYIIAGNPRKAFFDILLKTNAKYIISATKIPNLLSRRFKTTLLFLPSYRNNGLLHPFLLARRINPKLYDSKFPNLDMSKARIQTDKKHKTSINEFLNNSVQTLPNQPYFWILLNPFSNATTHTLSIQDWISLLEQILALPQCLIIVVTYDKVHSTFMENLAMRSFASNRLFIYKNNNDVLYLVEMVSQMSCVISPSTGTIHIASHLQIPTIGLYSKKDTKKWQTWDRDYVIIPKPSSELSQKQIDTILKQTIKSLQHKIASHLITPKFIKAPITTLPPH